MSRILLGDAVTVDRLPAGPQVEIDLERLLVTRLLVQANSGGGKSWVLRRLLEQTFGLVPQVVLDVDDEFHTLREKYPYVLAGAAGGDCRADTRTAALLARRVLEHGFSVIIGIYELKKHERMRFVRLFLEALIEAPRSLWRPLLVVVDEAHLFCPEKEQAESAAAVTDLMTRGRKRGFCGVLATQRISKLNKDAAAEANNKLIGRSSLDVDMKRAGDELGFTTREQLHRLRALDEGHFYAFGPAIAREITLAKVGTVQTTHPEPGSRRQLAPPPPPDKLKAILSKLADLPKDAEAEETELERLRRENADLRRRPAAAAPVDQAEAIAKAQALGQRTGYLAALDSLAPAVARFCTLREAMADQFDALSQDLQRIRAGVERAAQSDQVRTVRTEPTYVRTAERATAAAAPRAAPGSGADRSGLQPVLARILDALAELDVLGVDTPERQQVAFLAGYANVRSKGFANALGSARSSGLIEYLEGGRLVLTDSGHAVARAPARPRTPAELHERLFKLLEPVHARVLQEVIKWHPESVTREGLAQQTGYENPRSKGFANAIGRLSGLGFIHYPEPGLVKAQPLLFLQAAR